jgi:hypothetical protein
MDSNLGLGLKPVLQLTEKIQKIVSKVPAAEIKNNKLQSELKSTKQKFEEERKSTEQTLREKEKEIQMLKESQNIEDMPQQLVDNKIGPVKVQNLSKINEFDRRGYQPLARRFGELVRRRLVDEGKATIKFYIISKDRSTLVPVNFTVDMLNRTTDMILDENRL